MSNLHNNFDKLYNEWKKISIETVEKVIPPVMKEKMKESVYIEVYMAYNPTVYEPYRRYGDNGMLDEDNYKYDITVTSKGIEVLMRNETYGNAYMPNNQHSILIDEIIISGEGYSWKGSGISKGKIPRDFYKKTEELLGDSDVRMKIISELKKNGINVK